MVWGIIAALFFIAFVFLAPRPDIENARPGTLESVRFPRATDGAPMPIVFGRARMRGPNTLYYGGFRTLEITEKVQTGIFSSEKVVVGFRYFLTLDLGLCMGGDISLHTIYVDKEKFVVSKTLDNEAGTITVALPSKGGNFTGDFRWYVGDDSAAQNAYIEAEVAETYPSYPGLCHIVLEDFEIGERAGIPVLNFEISRYTDLLGIGAAARIGDDINPVEALYAAVVQDWGGLGIGTLDIDTTSWIAAANTIATEGLLGFSVIVDTANRGRDFADEVLRHIDGIIYQDPETGKIIMKLIREDYDPLMLPVFDESNIVSFKDFSISTWNETANQVRILFNARDRDYNERGVTVQDAANIAFQGRMKAINMSFPAATEGDAAVAIATREMAQVSVPVFTVKFTVTREQFVFRPGDVFSFSWVEFNITQAVMRIQNLDLGELDQGKIGIEAIVDSFAAGDIIYVPPDVSLHVPIDNTPVDVATFIHIEAPNWYADNGREPDPLTGQALVMVLPTPPDSKSVAVAAYSGPVNGDDDRFVGYASKPFPLQATIETDYLIAAGFDDSYDTVGMRVENITGTLPTGLSTTDYKESGGLLFIGGEILSYEDAIAQGGDVWLLDNVRRALIDTDFEDHLVGDVVYFLDRDFTYLMNILFDNTGTAYTKILNSTSTQDQVQADVSSQSLVLTRRAERPLRPHNSKVEGSRVAGDTNFSITNEPTSLTWEERDKEAALITAMTGGTETPTGTVVYDISLYQGNTLIDEAIGETGTGGDLVGPFIVKPGTGEVRVLARDTVLTLDAHVSSVMPVVFTNMPTSANDSDPAFANVVLLAGFNGADEATTYTEESDNAFAATFFGAAELSTAVKVLGTASLNLLGSDNNYVTFPDDVAWDWTTDRTIRLRYTRTAAGGSGREFIVTKYDSNNERSWWIAIDVNSQTEGTFDLSFLFVTDKTDFGTHVVLGAILPGDQVEDGQDHEIAVTLDDAGDLWKLYFDGFEVDSLVDAGRPDDTSTAPIMLGGILNNGSPNNQELDGYVDEIRVSDELDITGDYEVRTAEFPRS